MRAAIIGAGLMGRWHAHALNRAGGRIVAVADTDAKSAQRLAQDYRIPAFDSLSSLLARNRVEAVHICTPLATHAELAMLALEAGAHVLVEKPLAPDARTTAQLLHCAQARGLLIVPVHQFIFQPGIRFALAQLPQLAPLVHLEATALTAGGEGLDDRARDQLVVDILPHALGLFERCLPNSLDRIEWTVCHPASGELRAIGESGGTALAINISVRGRPARNELMIIGGHGSISADLFHGFAVFERDKVSRWKKIFRPFGLATRTLAIAALNLSARAIRNEMAYPGLRELVGAFYSAICLGMPAPVSPQETLAVAVARDQLMIRAGI